MKHSILLILLLLTTQNLIGQANCSAPTATTFTQGNNIQAKINNNGTLFYGSFGGVFFPNVNDENLNTIEANAFWFGGVKEGDQVRVAGALYGNNGFGDDFTAGPLNNMGETEESTCENWDKIWKVYRYQIEAHKSDFADNGSINNPIPEIFNWPAKGNGLFPLVEGFPLPDGQQSLAPFHDENNNGIYDPLNGDFPLPVGVSPSKIPEEITYSIFNDNGSIHHFTGGLPIGLEVGQTSYSFKCELDNPLNNTLFISLQCTNKSTTTIDSFYFGQFIDYSIGCPQDDFMGSAPDLNAFYVYNSDNIDGEIDGFCGPPTYGYAENPPAQGMVLLNQPLSHFLYVDQNQINGGFPQNVWEHYRFLTGRWRDGSPITFGGTGYQTGLPTNFAFSGNPNDLNSWTMSDDLDLVDPRLIGSAKIGKLESGESVRIDLAQSFVHDEESSNLGNVTALFEQIEDIQAMYDNQFANDCEQTEICTDDCVWAGDANADGIANHCDLFPIALAMNKTGSARVSPHNWSPVSAQNWDEFFPNGTNMKHADGNGNGLIQLEDLEKTTIHYGLENGTYEAPPAVYSQGNHLKMNAFTGVDVENLIGGESFTFSVSADLNLIEVLYALGFSIEFDTTFLKEFSISPLGGGHRNLSSPTEYSFNHQQIDYSIISNTVNQPISQSSYLLISITIKDEIIGNAPTLSTAFRFKNIKALDVNLDELNLGGTDLNLIFTNVNSTKEASKNGFQIYPNPTSNLLTVEFPNKTIERIQIIDLNGKIVLEQQNQFSEKSVLNLGHLPKGIYFLKMENERNTFFQKVSVF